MRVLVSAASKHGATAEIGDHIGETLRQRGFDVTVAEPDDAKPDAGYDGIVLGSGVYAGHWLKDAKTPCRPDRRRRPRSAGLGVLERPTW